MVTDKYGGYAEFTDGVDGSYINVEDGLMYVEENLLWDVFGYTIDPPAEIDTKRDTIVVAGTIIVGVKGGALIYNVVKDTYDKMKNPRLDRNNYPKPPEWNDQWQWRYPEGEGLGASYPRWYDLEGGEWRWHAPDKYHSIGHWDYNPWTSWNSAWQNIYPK